MPRCSESWDISCRGFGDIFVGTAVLYRRCDPLCPRAAVHARSYFDFDLQGLRRRRVPDDEPNAVDGRARRNNDSLASHDAGAVAAPEIPMKL